MISENHKIIELINETIPLLEKRIEYGDAVNTTGFWYKLKDNLQKISYGGDYLKKELFSEYNSLIEDFERKTHEFIHKDSLINNKIDNAFKELNNDDLQEKYLTKGVLFDKETSTKLLNILKKLEKDQTEILNDETIKLSILKNFQKELKTILDRTDKLIKETEK